MSKTSDIKGSTFYPVNENLENLHPAREAIKVDGGKGLITLFHPRSDEETKVFVKNGYVHVGGYEAKNNRFVEGFIFGGKKPQEKSLAAARFYASYREPASHETKSSGSLSFQRQTPLDKLNHLTQNGNAPETPKELGRSKEIPTARGAAKALAASGRHSSLPSSRETGAPPVFRRTDLGSAVGGTEHRRKPAALELNARGELIAVRSPLENQRLKAQGVELGLVFRKEAQQARKAIAAKKNSGTKGLRSAKRSVQKGEVQARAVAAHQRLKKTGIKVARKLPREIKVARQTSPAKPQLARKQAITPRQVTVQKTAVASKPTQVPKRTGTKVASSASLKPIGRASALQVPKSKLSEQRKQQIASVVGRINIPKSKFPSLGSPTFAAPGVAGIASPAGHRVSRGANLEGTGRFQAIGGTTQGSRVAPRSTASANASSEKSAVAPRISTVSRTVNPSRVRSFYAFPVKNRTGPARNAPALENKIDVSKAAKASMKESARTFSHKEPIVLKFVATISFDQKGGATSVVFNQVRVTQGIPNGDRVEKFFKHVAFDFRKNLKVPGSRIHVPGELEV